MNHKDTKTTKGHKERTRREFTGEPFLKALADIGADPRIGAVGEHRSIAVTERFWLTAKTALDEVG